MRARELARAIRAHNADVLHDGAAVCSCAEGQRLRAAVVEAHERAVRAGQRETRPTGGRPRR